MEFFRIAFSVPLSWLFVRFFVTPTIRKMAQAHGMGRHTKEEVLHIARKDLTALSDFIGESVVQTVFLQAFRVRDSVGELLFSVSSSSVFVTSSVRLLFRMCFKFHVRDVIAVSLFRLYSVL